jgi:hypothetical protein
VSVVVRSVVVMVGDIVFGYLVFMIGVGMVVLAGWFIGRKK